jgi:hypothetical protein
MADLINKIKESPQIQQQHRVVPQEHKYKKDAVHGYYNHVHVSDRPTGLEVVKPYPETFQKKVRV